MFFFVLLKNCQASYTADLTWHCGRTPSYSLVSKEHIRKPFMDQSSTLINKIESSTVLRLGVIGVFLKGTKFFVQVENLGVRFCERAISCILFNFCGYTQTYGMPMKYPQALNLPKRLALKQNRIRCFKAILYGHKHLIRLACYPPFYAFFAGNSP